MMAAAPRLRQDLQAAPLQDGDGVVYYDVSDPRTGGVLRLYDFEWLVAERLDGQHSLDEVAEWARAELGLETTAEDLAVYAQRLGQLGMCDVLAMELPLPAAEPAQRAAPPAAVPAEPSGPTAPAEPAREPSGRAALPMQSVAAPADDVMGRPLQPAAAEAQETPEAPRKATLLMPTVAPAPAPGDAPATASGISERPTAPLAQIEPPPSAPPAAAEPEAPPEVARVTLPPAAAPPVTPAEQEAEASPASEPETAPVQRAAAGALPIDTSSGEMPAPAEAAELPVSHPVAPAGEDDIEDAEATGAGRWVALIVLLLALGIVAYLLFGLHRPPSVSVHVKRVQPHEVMRTLGASALVKKAAPQVLRMEGGGVLASVVGEGSEVSAGMSLAVLQSHAKLQKEITDLRERLAYYQRRRELATEKGDETAMREAQAKVTEKEERLAAAEAQLKKAQILATRSGKVTRVLAHAGDLVSPGSEILEIADRYLSAEVLLPQSEAQGLKAGETVQLEGPAGALSARIAGLQPQGGEVLVQLELSEESAAKPGDSLRLVRGRLSNVDVLPAPAVVEGDTVFVVSQGKAARRKITVLDHRGSDVLVTGLHAGEEVVVSQAAELHEGQLVRPVYGP